MSNNYGYSSNSNPYGQDYELDSYNNAGGDDDFVTFMNSIQYINEDLENYKQLIELIQFNQTKIVNEISEDTSAKQQLDSLISQASSLQNKLKQNIKKAQLEASHDTAKKAQAENSRQTFLKLIQDYRVIESNYREANKSQAAAQFKIVKPDATDDEVYEAINDVGGQQIFSQALMNSSRRGEAKTALQEVQSRHRELQRLEKTMAELTQLFHDMEEIVAEQNVQVENIHQSVDSAQKDVELGVGHTDSAAKSARKARNKKLWCYGILTITIIIIIVVIVVPIAIHFSN